METTDSTPNPEIEESKYKPWGNVTDPNKHDLNNFRYLIHAINPNATISMASIGAMSQQKQSTNKEDGDQAINLFREPERLHERVSLSCSLVDKNT